MLQRTNYMLQSLGIHRCLSGKESRHFFGIFLSSSLRTLLWLSAKIYRAIIGLQSLSQYNDLSLLGTISEVCLLYPSS